ncbi:hypothetical protein NW768_010780 [Fusarium equiseti]|uniref:DUF6604 domain-containing protein n=1 Tax=Fusarium equiseti TaxID=61235 RepID=A0ABQ8QZP9_FUSEQ|nr:hypothetical protein NW768_010780 [Fusarium equiseti]
MLPDVLIEGLQQYKSDTNALAAWLASTAKVCGYKCDIAHQKPLGSESHAPSGRLKGKARKEAKKLGTPANQGPKYTVALKDFLPMAECIANSRKPLITVPSSFVSTINRAIRLRSTFADEMAAHGVTVDLAAENSHGYFVSVLVKVNEALRPRFPPSQKTQAAQSPEKEDISRGFQALSVEEPSLEFLNAPDIELPQKAQGDSTSYKAETEAEFESSYALLLAVLFLDEAKSVRDQIQWMWQGYLDKNFDITAAAVATNVGIQRIRMLSEKCSSLGDGIDMMQAARMHFGVNSFFKGYTVEETVEMLDEGACPEDVLSELNNCFLYALCMITPLVEQTQDTLAFYRPGKVESTTVRNQGIEEEREALCDFWTEGVLFLHNNIEKAGSYRFPVEDEFLRILRKTNETNKVSFEMAFIAQIFLDLRRLLGNTESMVEKTMGCIAEMNFGLERFLELWDNGPNPDFIDPVRSQIKEGQEYLGKMIHDIIPEVKAYHVRNGFDVDGVGEYWRFLKRSPILCGLALFHARAEIYNLSMKCLKQTGITTKVVHLYNAIQQEGFLDKPWADMEAFEACFEEQDLFMHRKPKRSTQYHERLFMQLGFSLSSIMKLKRSSWREQVSAKHHKDMEFQMVVRGMENGAPVSNAYLRMHKQRGGFVDFTKEEVLDIVSLSKYKLVEENGQATFGPLSEKEKQEVNKRASQPKSKHATGNGTRPKSHYLLLLTMTLAAEARELAFSHLLMHDCCVAVLQLLHEKCRPVIEDSVFRTCLFPYRGPNDIIPNMLMLADWPNGDKPLKEAAAVISELNTRLEGRLRGRIQDIKSFSEPVVMPPVATGANLKWYSDPLN